MVLDEVHVGQKREELTRDPKDKRDYFNCVTVILCYPVCAFPFLDFIHTLIKYRGKAYFILVKGYFNKYRC